MRIAALLFLTLAFAGCTDGAEKAGTADTAPAAARDRPLPEVALDLVPESARDSLLSKELRLAECGITPTYPCVNAFFLLEDMQTSDRRLASLRRLAAAGGWRVAHVERTADGARLDLARRQLQARYTLGRDLVGPGAMVQLTVFGPAVRLPRPSSDERAAWSDARRAYVREANAVCRRTTANLVSPADLAPQLAKLEQRLSALAPPPGERFQVDAFLRPLRNLVRAMKALTDSKGEDALPAAVGVGHFTKRFVAAASRYGLVDCAIG